MSGVGSSIFDLSGRTVVVTGGAGLLGVRHAAVLQQFGARTVLLDLAFSEQFQIRASVAGLECDEIELIECDITDENGVRSIARKLGPVDVLVNNASNNPAMTDLDGLEASRVENLSIHQWNLDLAVGLTGAFLCSREFGASMADRGKGAIINICSDLAVIAPDQRLYRVEGRAESEQPVKPVSYSVVKSGLHGLTRYFSTYWSHRGVRCNSLSPGGVENDQSPDFLDRISNLIPLGRMAQQSELQGALIFLASDASSYVNGANLIVDGGRSAW